ncbi:MAG: sulfite exporter TauE/SafE family protein [Ferruginibacter sp.]
MGIAAIISTGLLIGFMGSFHCIGMCGPLALSLPVNSSSSSAARMIAVSLYNLGRAFTYASIGFFSGIIGNSFLVNGYQQAFSILLGTVVLFIWFSHYVKPFSFSNPFHLKVKQVLVKLLSIKKNCITYFLFGVANGLLPCGLVYLAVFSAMAAGTPAGGALLMFMFGMATFPLMFSFMILGKHFSFSFRTKLKKLTPLFVIMMCMLLVLRGLNLNIPYISPAIEPLKKEMINCLPK